MEYNRGGTPLGTKSYAFAVNIVSLVKQNSTNWSVKPLFDQLLRSGTSISANIREAEFAQSPADFVGKFYIALKEANETIYWLQLLSDTDCINQNIGSQYQNDCRELVSMLVASIKTVKTNQSQVIK